MTRPILNQVPLQDQLNVVLGLQKAELAKSVKGLDDETCDEVRGAMLGGAALTVTRGK
jgi:hypothetical protein